MSRLQVKLVLLTFAICLPLMGYANDSVSAWDNSTIEYRHPSPEKIEDYKALPEYRYDRYKAPESWWQRLLKWLVNQLSDKEVDINWPQWFSWIKNGFIVLGVLAIVILVVVLLKLPISGFFSFSRNTDNVPLAFSEDMDDIHNDKLADLLQIFIDNQSFREATRILYLICLKNLSDQELIKWEQWKTNRDYLFEIIEPGLKEGFKSVVHCYEYVWYGQFPVEHQSFANIQGQFNSFNKELQSKTKLA